MVTQNGDSVLRYNGEPSVVPSKLELAKRVNSLDISSYEKARMSKVCWTG